MPGMGGIKDIVKPSHQRNFTVSHMMPEYTEHFLGQLHFIYPIVVIQTRLCPPAQMQGRSHIGSSPVHNTFQFFPVIDFLKRHLLYWRPCYDKSIKLSVSYTVKSLIKFIDMACGSIFGYMAFNPHKCHIHLQGRIRKRTQNLQFRVLF